MLVSSQWSVGLTVAAVGGGPLLGLARWPTLLAAAGLGVAAAGASFLHLGQPLKAWRVVLGWSHSWLSREAIAIAAYVGLTSLAVGLDATWNGVSDGVDLLGPVLAGLATIIGVGAALLGLGAVYCSAMIYVVTGRYPWRADQTAARFGGTTAIAALAALTIMTAASDTAAPGWAVVAAGGAMAVLVGRLLAERSLLRDPHPDAQRSADLLGGPLRGAATGRLLLAIAGGATLTVGAIAAVAADSAPAATTVLAAGAIVLVAADLAERRLFFQACAPRTMPGAHR
jgi:DMSO reductase anchor subunit